MLIPKPQLNLRNAREYFREHLAAGKYYSADQKVTGEWFGQGAEKLGLKGNVHEADFLRLCEGLHPGTGDRLTQRKNDRRQTDDGKIVANRRVFYDFTISPPKSVSIVALMRDDRILDLHNRAVRQAMLELERFAETRVRKSGQNVNRATGNLLGSFFRHETSRELDPHLHTHCVIFNATFDATEGRWKALQVETMYRAQKFVENHYFHELAKGLRGLGYQVENQSRAFRIKGVPESLTSRFSKRHAQIDQKTEERIKRDGWQGNVKDLRERIARDVRRRKEKDSTAERLRPSWESQMTAPEKKALGELGLVPLQVQKKADLAGIVAWADQHLFERRSVVNDFELMSAALERGRGEDFNLGELRQVVDGRDYFREEGSRKLTSREVLRWELEVVVAAHDGRDRHWPLIPDYRASTTLSAEQAVAVEKIMQSEDFITLFRGGAGTGKSFALKEVERGLVAVGRPVVVLAPQCQQVQDLQEGGLAASTLASFLQEGKLEQRAVVIADEAGQIGAREMGHLIRIVKANGGRLILSGDTRQHGAVAASDALRSIEKHSGLKPAVIQTIRRQDPRLGATARQRAFIRAYRKAVKAAAGGDTASSFDALDRLGCIREVGGNDRREALASEYLAAVGRRERALVVAQTREEVRSVNEVIRAKLQEAGKLGPGTTLTTFQPVDLDAAQKRDSRFYQEGQFAWFLRGYGRFARGEACSIIGANEHGVLIEKNGLRSTVSYRYTDRLIVAAANQMAVAPGDRLQLKFNGRSVEGTRLNNGELVTVREVAGDGSLVVDAGAGAPKTLAPAQRLFVRGYAVTSHGSQGKTVDTVILADAASRAATDARQWYVTISRGRKQVLVFTPDKAALRSQIQQAGTRELALDLKLEQAPLVPARQLERSRRQLAVAVRFQAHQAIMARVNQSRANLQRIHV